MCRRRIEAGLIGFTDGNRFLHRVANFKDDAPSAVLAVCFLVLAADNWEGGHHVVYSGARRGEATLEFHELFGCFVTRTHVGSARWTPIPVLLGR